VILTVANVGDTDDDVQRTRPRDLRGRDDKGRVVVLMGVTAGLTKPCIVTRIWGLETKVRGQTDPTQSQLGQRTEGNLNENQTR
jgi:hypothetical protein